MFHFLTLWIQIFGLSVWGYESYCPLDSLQHFENSVYSQNGEDGILLAILDAIGRGEGTYVEFGVQDGRECNSRLLRERFNFTGIMMDGDHNDANINLHKEFVTVYNILELFDKYGVSKHVDVLSVDVDMFDWWILARLLGVGQYRPRVIIVEVNPTLGISSPSLRYHFHEANSFPLVVPHPSSTTQRVWDLSRFAGANPIAYQALGNAFGYDMVYCESCGVNCFLVLREELPSSCNTHDGISKFTALPKVPYPCYGSTSHNYIGHIVDAQHRLPLLITPELLAMATTDSLLHIPSGALQHIMTTASVATFPRTSLSALPAMCKTNSTWTSDTNAHQLTDMVRSMQETPYTVAMSSFCFTLRAEKAQSGAPDCRVVAQLLYEEAMADLPLLQFQHENNTPPKDMKKNISTGSEWLRSVVLEGLKFDHSHPHLLTLLRYLSVLEALDNQESITRYAHALQSFISPDGTKGHTVIGLGICDNPAGVSAALQKRWSLNTDGRLQVQQLLVRIRRQQTFRQSFDDIADSFDFMQSSENDRGIYNPLHFLPECLRDAVPSPLRKRLDALCLSRHSTRTVLVMSPPYGGAESVGQTISHFIHPTNRSKPRETNAAARGINNQLVQVLSNCTRPTGSGWGEESRQMHVFYACLARTLDYTLDGEVVNGKVALERLGNGDLSEIVHPQYDTAIDNALQSMYTISLDTPGYFSTDAIEVTTQAETFAGESDGRSNGVKVLADSLFSYTASAWYGPMGVSTTQFQIVLTLLPPLWSIRCMMSEQQLSPADAIAVYVSHFRSMINTINQLGSERISLLNLDTNTLTAATAETTEISMEEIGLKTLLSSLEIAFPMTSTDADKNKIYMPTCMVRSARSQESEESALTLPAWLIACYDSLVAAAQRGTPVRTDMCNSP